MNRRINSTGRIRIPRDKFTIRLNGGVHGRGFSADLGGLGELGLAPTARVIVEPYVRQSSMRFDFGTLGQLTPPGDTALREIDQGAPIQFRIRVIDTELRPGCILALVDQVRPVDQDEDDDRKSILPVQYLDIGEELWRVEVNADASPVLVVNSRIPDASGQLHEGILPGAVFPHAIREILRVLIHEDVDLEQEWVQDWRAFAGGLLGEQLPAPGGIAENSDELVDTVVERFCKRERFATTLIESRVPIEVGYE